MFSNGQATLTTEVKDLNREISELWGPHPGGYPYDLVQPSGMEILQPCYSCLVKRRVCTLWVTSNVTWTITQASDFGRMNVSERAYIKNLTKEEPMRHKVSVLQTEVTCTDVLGSPTRPTQGHLLKKLVEAQGVQPAPPRHCLVQPNQELSDSSLSSFKFQIKFT